MSDKALILTVGFSVDPLIMTINEVKPKRVAFIGTEDSISKTIDVIIEKTTLLPSQYKQLDVQDSSDSIGKLISKFKEAYNWILNSGISKENIIVDATGGKKWMSSGATMIASFLGLVMIYVDADQDPISKKIDPKTMRIVPLGNAYDQTGLLMAEQGKDAFNKYYYEESSNYFGRIKPTLSYRAEFFQGMASLADVLAKWDKFEHYSSKISDQLDYSIQLLDRSLKTGYSSNELFNFVEQLRTFHNNIKLLENMNQLNASFIIDLLLNAERRFEVKRHDDSIARLYRTLEAISQYFLLKDCNIDTSVDIDWSQIEPECLDKFKEIANLPGDLPKKIDLLRGYQLLLAHDSKVAKDLFNKGKNGYQFAFTGLLSDRNHSILAHGFKPMSSTKVERFINEIRELLRGSIDQFEELEQKLKAPKLPSLENLL